MAQARVCILLLALTAAIAAVSGADDLQAQGQKTAAGFQQQLLAALAKLRSDYDAAEAAEIKAASAEVKAALQKGSAALAKMRVPQRAALQALAKQVGKEAGELFGKYTALISKYQKDKVQSCGLQAAYNDPDNRETKIGVHMLLDLVFVPRDDVKEAFRDLQRTLPDTVTPIITYLKETYIMGTTNRRTRRLNAPRFPLLLWNQYGITLRGEHRTNNLSEEWHNRFRLVVGKHHPDLYSSLKEFQKEQVDTEAQLAEFSLGRRIRAATKKKWRDQQLRFHTIVLQYEQFKEPSLSNLKVLPSEI